MAPWARAHREQPLRGGSQVRQVLSERVSWPSLRRGRCLSYDATLIPRANIVCFSLCMSTLSNTIVIMRLVRSQRICFHKTLEYSRQARLALLRPSPVSRFLHRMACANASLPGALVPGSCTVVPMTPLSTPVFSRERCSNSLSVPHRDHIVAADDAHCHRLGLSALRFSSPSNRVQGEWRVSHLQTAIPA